MCKKFLAVLLALCMTLCLLPTAALAEESRFSDVEGHWAADSIDRWAGYGVLNGKGDGDTFDPNEQMTRAEFATMLVSLMGYTEASDESFSDLEGHWGADAILKLVKAGVMNGMGDGSMNPEGQITREQAAVMLCRAFNLKPSKDASLTFSDSANVSSWAKDAMAALSERDMISGVGNNQLAPGGIVSRAAAAKLADNMIGEYVTEDKVITGEVKGIVLVVNGAKAEIKDATLSAPVVVKDSTAVLTNTKAEDVVADGGSVSADAKTTVANVTLTGDAPVAKLDGKVEGSVSASGTKPQVEVKGDIAGEVTIGGSDAKVDLKGEVAGGVTVAEDATGKPQVTAPKGTEVANKSETEATVNGSKVEAGSETTTTTTPSTPSTGDTGTTTPSTPSEPDPVTPENCPDKATHAQIAAGEKCPKCGYTGTAFEKPEDPKPETVHTHNYGEGTVTKEATCTEDGVKTFTCTGDGECDRKTYTEAIPATGHTWIAEGQENAGKCENCDATKPADHTCSDNDDDYTIVTVDSTCTSTGYTKKTCKTCGAVTTTEIAKKAHTEVAIGEAVAATCVNKGITAGKKCSVCGTITEAQEEIAVNSSNHASVKNVPAKAATCTEDGHEAGTKCEACNTAITTGAKIAKLGHDYDAGTVTTQPTCTEKGTKTITCKRTTCTENTEGHTKTEEIPATGHSYEAEGSTEKPTNTSDTQHTYTCTKCAEGTTGHTKTEDHKYDATTGLCVCGAKKVYTITVSNSIQNGTVTLDKPDGANKDDTVVLTVTAAEGYQLKANTLRVMNGDTEVTATAGTGENANKYTFTMPAAAVTVTAEFEATTTPEPDPEP